MNSQPSHDTGPVIYPKGAPLAGRRLLWVAAGSAHEPAASTENASEGNIMIVMQRCPTQVLLVCALRPAPPSGNERCFQRPR